MVREFTREDDCRILLVLDPHLSAEDSSEPKPGASAVNARFERAVNICASLAWHFYENNSLLQFRSAGVETPLAPADQAIFPILQHLAVARSLPPDPSQSLMADLATSPELFKIIVTGRPHGSVPGPVWSSSYVVSSRSGPLIFVAAGAFTTGNPNSVGVVCENVTATMLNGRELATFANTA